MKVWRRDDEKSLRQSVTVHLLYLKYVVAVKRKEKNTFKATVYLLRVKQELSFSPEFNLFLSALQA